MNSVGTKALITIVLVCAIPVFGQADQNIVRLDLKEFPHDSANSGPPDTLPVYVEIATFQPDVEQGIVFTLNIENNSANTIRIMDPIDRLHIGLLGLARPFSKNLRNTSPDSSVCFIRSLSAEKLKTLSDDKRTKRPFQAFDATGRKRIFRLKTIKDIVPWEPPQNRLARSPRKTAPLSDSELFEVSVGGKLTLEPGERFHTVLQITQVHAKFEAYEKAYDQWLSDYIIPNPQGLGTTATGAPPRPEPETIPIPSGKFSLRISILLLTDKFGSIAPSTKRVTIQLGEPSGAE